MRESVHQPASASIPTEESARMAWRQFDEAGFRDPLLERIAERFRVLGEPLRLKILAALVQGDYSVNELARFTGSSQPNISKHLAVLAQSGLVTRRKAGVSSIYALADPSVSTLCDVVCAGVQAQMQAQAQAIGLPIASSHPDNLNDRK